MLSFPIFIPSSIKIFIESKNAGGICRQNMHLSIESAWKWDIVYKIASIGLRLDRPQLQHWLFFWEHNWPTPKSENSNVVGLLAPTVCPLPATYCSHACLRASKMYPFSRRSGNKSIPFLSDPTQIFSLFL